jgi:large subunit ribosomal protein L17
MHRHGYKGRKFGRERDQRRALIKSLADSLVLRESIETTLPKAKELSSYAEKLITKAKKGGLHNRRQIISSLNTLEAAHKLVDEIAPKLTERNSGYLRVERTELRRGDNAQMATISFVDDLTVKNVAKKSEVKPAEKKVEAKPAPARRRTSKKEMK